MQIIKRSFKRYRATLIARSDYMYLKASKPVDADKYTSMTLSIDGPEHKLEIVLTQDEIEQIIAFAGDINK